MRTAEMRAPVASSDQLGIADKLAFLSCYSRYYLSVSAENHSHLAQLLLHELEGVAPISVLSPDEIRKFDPTLLVANGFGLREASPGSNTALEVINGLVEDSAVRPLVIVEDVDKVSDEKLRQLLILAEQIGLGLAFFGERPVIKRKAFAQFDSRIFQTTVAKLSASDVRHLVRRRSTEDAKLSEIDIEHLVDRSDGQIDKLDGLIDEMIETPGRKLGLPLVHMSALVILAIVMVGGWMSLNDDDTTSLSIDLKTKPSRQENSFSAEKDKQSVLFDGESSLKNQSVIEEPGISSVDQSFDPKPTNQVPTTDMSPAGPSVEKATPTNEVEVVNSQQEIAAAPAYAESSPTRLEDVDPNAWVNDLPATAAGVESSVTRTENALPQKTWLQSAPDSAYTLQIMGSHSESRVLSFIAEQGNGHEFGYFKTIHRNQPWYVLTVGQYQGREQALLAIEVLPPQLRAQKPWARNVASIRGQ